MRMKKNVLMKSFITFCLLTFSILAQAQCYIIGNNGGWNSNVAEAELSETSEAGVYEGTVVFTQEYFTIVTKLGSNWGMVEEYRYGPLKDGTITKLDTPTDMHNPVNVAYKVPVAGVYKVRVDFNNSTVTVSKEKPASIKFVQGENITELPCTDTEKGIYQGTIELTSHTFYIQEGEYIYGGDREMKPNALRPMTPNFTSFTMERLGTYEVTVNLNTMKIKLYDENYVTEYPDELFFIGNTGSWDCSTANATLSQTSIDGVYSGKVPFTSYTFAIVSQLAEADDWETLKQYRYIPIQGEEPLDINASIEMTKATIYTCAFALPIEKVGNTYLVTVDLRNNKLYILDETYLADDEYPKELYILGSDNVFQPYVPSAILPATEEEPYIYKGKINVESGKVILLRRLGETWGFVNDERLGVYEAIEKNIELHKEMPLFRLPSDIMIENGEHELVVNLKDFTICVDGLPTSIKGITTSNETTESMPYFDLSGRNVGNALPSQKGIYIHQNKKIVIK